ncbi:MAG: EH signature domain-containing protein [Mastigocoleus sp. MO_167.B18]|nr:EH signature domain-containing protein [Mastigocoleus sp. MO_167.B18]
MNINFRKIDLPPLPVINASALIKLTENYGNSTLRTPALPNGAAKSKIISRSNLDEIIQDIENGQIENITVLEWVHCLYNKNKWDSNNPSRSISTSKAIWKAAERNNWLKQRLFWNLVLHLEFDNVLASSLVNSYTSFSPKNPLDKRKLAIVQVFRPEYLDSFIKLCWSTLLTPNQLLTKYQLPAEISITKKSYDHIAHQFSNSDRINHQHVEWLLKCLEQMNRRQQVRTVEHLLIQVNQHIVAEFPVLIDWLRQHYGSAVANSRWNELSAEAKVAMRKWIGAVSYQDFQKLVMLILNRLHLEDWEKRRLNSRSGFWSNYSDRFERIRILLPESSINILGNDLNSQDVTILRNDGSDPTEICIFDFADWFLVEFFRGNGSETRIFPKNYQTEQQLFNSQLSIKQLRALDSSHEIHDHVYCWQYFCERWLRQKKIFPNEGTERFQGVPNQYNTYNPLTGLPEPSDEDMRKRDQKLKSWRENMAKLERKAEYSEEYLYVLYELEAEIT